MQDDSAGKDQEVPLFNLEDIYGPNQKVPPFGRDDKRTGLMNRGMGALRAPIPPPPKHAKACHPGRSEGPPLGINIHQICR